MENNKFSPNNSGNINNDNCNNTATVPIITYANVDTNRSTIFKENRNKSGVYR